MAKIQALKAIRISRRGWVLIIGSILSVILGILVNPLFLFGLMFLHHLIGHGGHGNHNEKSHDEHEDHEKDPQQ